LHYINYIYYRFKLTLQRKGVLPRLTLNKFQFFFFYINGTKDKKQTVINIILQEEKLFKSILLISHTDNGGKRPELK